MFNIVRQGHDDRFNESFTRICVHWDLLLLCNYKCSYCYARNPKFYGEDWLKVPSMEHQRKIIDAISMCEHPMNIGLLGGEPTLHPHFRSILEYLVLRCGYNKRYNTRNNIYIVSNGSRDLKWYADFEKLEGVSFLWSFHPEFADVDSFVKNVKAIRDKGFGTKVNIMLHPSKKYWEKIVDVYLKCKDNGFKVHPHFLYQENANVLWRYSEEFWEWSKKWFGEEERDLEFQEDLGGDIVKHLFNDFEVYSKKVNRFKGFRCMNSNYEINANGRVIMFCAENVVSNLIDNPNFFEKIGINNMVCPHEFCNCDGLLKIKKYRDGYGD